MVALVLLIEPLAASAQLPARVPRIGILSPAPEAAASPGGTAVFDAFREALHQLGYVEGKSIALEFRLAGGKYERLQELAADLVRLPVDIIVTDGGDAVARAALDATRTIPIVMATVNEPVANGLVASIARPGGNITGFTLAYVELATKRLQLLKEMIPTVTRVGVLWDQGLGPSEQLTAARRQRRPRSACSFCRCRYGVPRTSRARSRPRVASVPARCCSWPRGCCSITGRRSSNVRSSTASRECSN
jgi:ABC-type uncharacterized transport system substrate-binding protein